LVQSQEDLDRSRGLGQIQRVVTLKIGEVAARAEVGVDTVRFYERRGVLRPVGRRASGYRQFTAATVERIRFVKILQGMGFSLDEIIGVLRDMDAGSASCAGERPRVERVLARLDEKIAVLRRSRRRLLATIDRCRRGTCTLVEPRRRA
jgi:DNA-binding transcriptional MerR regulator